MQWRTWLDEVVGLKEAVEALAAREPVSLADPASVVELYRLQESLAAVAARATAAFDASRAWESDGARTAAAWLSTTRRLPMATARQRVRLGRALREMPAVEKAWLSGEVNTAQVSQLAEARAWEPEVFARDEQLLCDLGSTMRFADFLKAATYWRHRADPDEADRRAEKQVEQRSFRCSETFGGAVAVDGEMEPVGGSIFGSELRRLEQLLFEQDWAEAKARVGDGVSVKDLRRTAPQRRHDAAVQMAVRSVAMAPGSRAPSPLFTVLVGLDSLRDTLELARGIVLRPLNLLPYLTDALIERVVFESPSRVMDLSVRTRLYSGATRRALEVRDRRCTHPFCEVPGDECEGDHELAYSKGGLTTEANGKLLCDFHNRLKRTG